MDLVVCHGHDRDAISRREEKKSVSLIIIDTCQVGPSSVCLAGFARFRVSPGERRQSMQWVKLSEKEWMNADGCPWGGVWLFQGWMDRGRQGERAGRRNATLQPQPSRAKVDISESVIASSDRPTDRPRHSLPTLTNLPVVSCFISTERPTLPSRRYLPVFLCIFFSFARSLFVGMSPTEPRS